MKWKEILLNFYSFVQNSKEKNNNNCLGSLFIQDYFGTKFVSLAKVFIIILVHL